MDGTPSAANCFGNPERRTTMAPQTRISEATLMNAVASLEVIPKASRCHSAILSTGMVQMSSLCSSMSSRCFVGRRYSCCTTVIPPSHVRIVDRETRERRLSLDSHRRCQYLSFRGKIQRYKICKLKCRATLKNIFACHHHKQAWHAVAWTRSESRSVVSPKYMLNHLEALQKFA